MNRIRAILKAPFHGILPWWMYEKKKHHGGSYWVHLWANLCLAYRWFFFLEDETDREFEKPKTVDDLIDTALKSFDHYDACDDCGKRTDGLMTCEFADGTTTKLCPTCMKDSGFCYGCGQYCSGQSDFDFSDIPGYCSNCRDELRDLWEDDDGENLDPNDYPH